MGRHTDRWTHIQPKKFLRNQVCAGWRAPGLEIVPYGTLNPTSILFYLSMFIPRFVHTAESSAF